MQAEDERPGWLDPIEELLASLREQAQHRPRSYHSVTKPDQGNAPLDIQCVQVRALAVRGWKLLHLPVTAAPNEPPGLRWDPGFWCMVPPEGTGFMPMRSTSRPEVIAWAEAMERAGMVSGAPAPA